MDISVVVGIATVLIALIGYPVKVQIWDPVHKHMAARLHVHKCLRLYAREIGTPPPGSEVKANEVSDAFRAASCDLTTTFEAIRFHKLFLKLRIMVASREEVFKGAAGLMLLSNLIPISQPGDYVRLIVVAAEIEESLHFNNGTHVRLVQQLRNPIEL